MHKKDEQRSAYKINNLSLLDFKIHSNELDNILKQANYEIGRLNGLLEILTNLEILSSPLLIMESVKSSNIENINSTILDQLQLDAKGRKPYNSEQKETENYRLALLAGFDYLRNYKTFNLELIELIQKKLEPNQAGIRNLQDVGIVNTATAEIIWKPPVGKENILKFLENWLVIVNQNDEIDNLIKVSILHSQFEAIHPFIDGNGRTGRILIILYLIFKGYITYPCLYLSDYILKTRTYYYLHLHESQQHKNYTNLVKYIVKGIQLKAEHSSNLILKINQMKAETTSLLLEKLPKIYSSELINYLFYSPFYSINSICSSLNITRNTASKYLHLLVDHDFIEIYESKRTVLYFNPKLLRELV